MDMLFSEVFWLNFDLTLGIIGYSLELYKMQLLKDCLIG